MAIAVTTWNTTLNQLWYDTGAATDPSIRLNTQLNNWVTGIGSTSIINIQATPASSSLKNANSGLAWILQTPEGEDSDWGIVFHPRRRDNLGSAPTEGAPLSPPGCSYYQRIPGSANNGYGSYTTLGTGESSAPAEDFSSGSGGPGRALVIYEPSGPNPYFVYSWERSSDYGSRILRAMFRVNPDDIEPGSYYPGSGIAKWIYLAFGDSTASIRVPIRDLGVPQKGLFLSGYKTMDYAIPSTNATAAGYFFKPFSQYGDVHYLGKIPNVLISNTSTGAWGDTVTISGTTYTCLGNYNSTKPFDFWVRSSD